MTSTAPTPVDALGLLVERAQRHGIALLDPGGRVVSWSPAAARISGWAAETIIGQEWAALFPNADRASGVPQRLLLTALGTGAHQEQRSWLGADGMARSVMIDVTTLAPGDQARGFGVIFHPSEPRSDATMGRTADAGELGQLTQALRRSQDDFRSVIDAVEDYAFIMLDSDARVTSWNTGAERLLGWTEAEMIGQLAHRIFTPEDRAAGVPDREVETARRHGRSNDERWHMRRSGERFFAVGMLFAARHPDGTLRGFIKIMRDRTAERLADERQARLREELAAQRSLYETVLEQMPTGVVLAAAPDGRLLFNNGEAERLLGHPMLPNDGWNDYVRYGGLDADGAPLAPDRYPLARAVRSGEVIQQEHLRYRRGDGRLVHLSVNATPIRDANGDTVMAVTTFHDISEAKHYEEALRQANRELEQFAYVASHDLQEPLRMVAGYLTLLKRRHGPALDEQGREYLATAVNGAERMQGLIRDLLDFARIDREPPRLEPVRLVEVVEEALGNLGRALHDSGGTVLYQDLPTVRGEYRQLVRLFQNLVGNALTYCREDAPPDVRIAATLLGERWQVTVSDNGIGIPPDQRERIFEAFQRLHTRQEVPGTGIGLAICRKIVDRHGGRIWAEDAPGGQGGTAFQMTLPGG